jgi:hypothetical protein
MTVQLQANKPIPKVTPHELFDDALPKILTAYKNKGMKVTGTYEVNVFAQGGGRWFINAGECIVRAANNDQTDCVLEMGVDDVLEGLGGLLDAGKELSHAVKVVDHAVKYAEQGVDTAGAALQAAGKGLIVAGNAVNSKRGTDTAVLPRSN